MPLTNEQKKAHSAEQRKWCKVHPERARDVWQRAGKKYRNAHPKRNRERNRKYAETHREQVNAYAREYKRAHRKQITASFRRWMKTPAGQAYRNNQRARRRSVENQATGKLTAQEWRDILAHYNYKCAYCGHDGRLEIDHIIPITKHGTNTIENIAPACRKCNASKGNRAVWIPRVFSKEKDAA